MHLSLSSACTIQLLEEGSTPLLLSISSVVIRLKSSTAKNHAFCHHGLGIPWEQPASGSPTFKGSHGSIAPLSDTRFPPFRVSVCEIMSKLCGNSNVLCLYHIQPEHYCQREGCLHLPGNATGGTSAIIMHRHLHLYWLTHAWKTFISLPMNPKITAPIPSKIYRILALVDVTVLALRSL